MAAHKHAAHLLCGRALLGAESITVGGRSFTPDTFATYFECKFAHSLPVATINGQAMLPAVLARSWPTVLNKWVNIGHLMKTHAPKSIPKDSIVGSIVAAEFTGTADSPIPATKDLSPHIRAAAVLWREADGAKKLLKDHHEEKKTICVSMEVYFVLSDCHIAWPVIAGETPPVVEGAADLGGGWHSVAYTDAPKELKSTVNSKTGYVTKDWEGRRPVLLLGGVNGSVEFMGLGLVGSPFELESEVLKVLAGGPFPMEAADERGAGSAERGAEAGEAADERGAGSAERGAEAGSTTAESPLVGQIAELTVLLKRM